MKKTQILPYKELLKITLKLLEITQQSAPDAWKRDCLLANETGEPTLADALQAVKFLLEE